MGEGKQESAKSFDPFEPFRGMRDAYLDSMAKVMVEAVNTEGYAQANGALLDTYLTASAPFREGLEKWMVLALQQLSLPSRQEVAVLGERFTNLEMRIDDVDAKLDQIIKMDAKLDQMVNVDAKLDQIVKLIAEARPAAASTPRGPAKPEASAEHPRTAASKTPAAAMPGATGTQKTSHRQSARKSER